MNKPLFIVIGLTLIFWGFFAPGIYRMALWIAGIITITFSA